MIRVLDVLTRHAPKILAIGVLIGLAFPQLASLCRPLLTPSVWVLLLLTALRIDWAEIVAHIRRHVLVGGVLLWLLIAAPALMALLVFYAGSPPGLAAALVMMAAAPPIMSSPALAVMIGLDASLSLVVMVAATLLAPLTLPVVALELLALPMDMSVGGLMLRLSVFVGSALIAALGARRLIGVERPAANAARIDALAVVLLVLFAVAIMDGVTARLVADPLRISMIVGLAFIAYASLQAAGAAVFSVFGRDTALSVGFSSGNRNMALLLAVLPAGVNPDIPLYFALGQLPIYVLPAALTPLYRRILRRK